MKTFDYIITDPEGIHARPAGELIKAAKGFACSIVLEKEGKKADLKKSILALMGLAVKKDQKVTLTFDGEDEDAAYEAVTKFLQENL